jgi:MFS family permease
MSDLIPRLHKLVRDYPAQFWLIFVGMLISTIGASMIWPFLMIYVSKKLAVPLTQVASLITINALMGLVFALVAGPIIDRVGRKWVMVISLVGNGLVYVLLSQAQTYAEFALAEALLGAFNPLYRVGADAMIADLIPPEKRPTAYAILRMSGNTGVAIGPAIGGFVAVQSYATAFFIASGGMIVYGLLIALKARETLPVFDRGTERRAVFEGYGRILRDREFMSFTFAFTLTSMLASLIWILLPVYSNLQFGIPENRYGFIPTTNALMVVTLQYLVTTVTKRFKPLSVMTVGTAFYAAATALIALFGGFWGFWFCMVVMTVGELILIPTSNTYTANLAPADMRGRYMSIYGLTHSVASGIAPLVGGFLSDTISPRATWVGGGMIGLISVLAFLALTARYRQPADPGEVLAVPTINSENQKSLRL